MADIRGAYDRWSETYDTQQNPTRDLDALVLQRLVPALDGLLTVVEAGAGTGKNTAWLAPRCARLIGLDFSPGMLQVARHRVRSPHVQFLLHDIQQPWPLADASADIVLFNLILEHIESLEPVFCHAARVMRPGARLLISEFHPGRVLEGKGARIDQGEEPGEFVGTFLHLLEEYVVAGSAAGLELESTAEWTVALLGGSTPDADELQPLILSLCFAKRDDVPAA
ncbi:MAG: class I SAM-dependent methyltransferase [Chloroflexi bacterium]|nr:class I SAM-dependent methyltransferase [Chloroflexota bacterium]MBU1746428.1 class I SAM-dependent methyltransferase [Chloroflexota bacterium]MBU1877806.1 class I SAM-dependent methyltransferase [Chloroflexota bacterium]